MIEKLEIDFGQPVPLFPLPDCVLMPHATVPLHIYESRYQCMVKDALDSRGLIAMSLFRDHTWKQDYQGSPPVRSHVCIGYIVRHETLDNGRYNLLLQGICRAQIQQELPHEPYRVALVEPTEPRLPMEIDMDEHRSHLEALLCDPLLKQLACVSAIHNWVNTEIPTAALVDLASMTVCSNVEQRYTMLADPDAIRRAAWLIKLLEQTRHTLAIAERYRPELSADGHCCN